jgi:hypothetical protein
MYGRPISPCEIWWMAELYQFGLSINRIAEMEKRGANAVHQLLIRIGRHAVRKNRIPETKQGREYARYQAPVTYTTRECMCCQRPFQSEGIHNRLCGYCRGKEAGSPAYTVSGGRTSRGSIRA